MDLTKRGDTWYLVKGINGQRYRVSTGFADKKSAERRAVEVEHDIRSGILGWKSTIPSFAEWWTVYRATFTPTMSSKNRDAQIDAKAALKEQLDAEGKLWTQNQQRLRKVLAGGAVRARTSSRCQRDERRRRHDGPAVWTVRDCRSKATTPTNGQDTARRAVGSGPFYFE
jgi:hypothetical protein